MTLLGSWWSRTLDLPCTIEIEQTHDYFHAHLALDAPIEIRPGDRVQLQGAPISVAFGDKLIEHRRATVRQANWLVRAWTIFLARFQLQELYEVSFSPTRNL